MVLDLAQEEQEALSEARGTTKTSAAQRTPPREREKELSFRDKSAASVFSVCSTQLRLPHSLHCGEILNK